MSSMSKLLRTATLLLALAFVPRLAEAQKALVYCPVDIDATGCATIKTALTSAYPGGIETGYDGTQGTVDLKTVDLFQYSVVVVPSLADDSVAPYALLRDATVASKLKAALLGRRAFWSGTPDQGITSTTRPQKDALIQNLAAWASGDFATVNAPGLVVLQDNSTTLTQRYDWVKDITGFALIADTKLASYSAVTSLTAAGNAILSSNGSTLAFSNMASMGFQTPSGAPGTSMDAVGKTGTGVGGQVVLITQSGANTGGAVVTTDKDDYAPGTPVEITGAGFGAGETVTLTLHEDPTIEPDFSFTATADQNGGFVFNGFTPDTLDVDVRFVLTVTGQTSGRRAQTTFTDGQPQSVTVSAPTSVTVLPGSTATYTVNVTMSGNGNACTILMEVTTGLPVGATAAFNSNPVVLASGSGSNNFTRTLTITTNNSGAPNTRTPAGTYPFTVRATRGVGCQTGGQDPTVGGTLVVQGVSSQTITFGALANKTYGDPDFTVSATGGGSGNPVTFSATGSCTVSTVAATTTVHLTAAGTCSIAADQAGNASFSAAPTVTQSFTIAKATPVITWATPSSIIYGAALGSTQLNATASVPGTFTYTPAAGTVLSAGNSQSLSVSFTPTDAVSYTTASKAVTIDVQKADATITWVNPANIVYGTALSATQLNASTNSDGTLTYSPVSGTVLNGGSQTLTVTTAATQNFKTATKSVTLVVDQADQLLTWANPADITYGTALGAVQLNATTSGDGALTYTPALGTVLSAGSGLTLSVSAAATTNYKAATKSVLISVTKATPTITWATPAGITYGTALSSTQLNATASVPGTFTYTPASGVVLDAGSQTLSVSFAPTDAANYNLASATVTLAIAKADPSLGWNDPADIVYGTKLSSTQLNATTSGDGALTYTPASGTLLGAGNAQTLTVSSAVTTNYNATTKSVKINVSKADQSISWNYPADITYPAPLSSTELNAVVTGVAGGSAIGAVTYSPVSGTILNAGTHTLTINVAGTSDYNPASQTVSLVVNKATPVVTWNAPADITYGTTLSSTQLNATANVPGTFVYTPDASTLLNAGAAQQLSVAFTPNDAVNYNSVPQTTTSITVLKADQTITWVDPAGITYGAALNGTQLNASVAGVAGGSATGAVSYTPAAGTLLDAGTQSLRVDVAQTSNYNAAFKIVSIAVAKADQTITWSNPASIVYGTTLGATQLNASVAGVSGGSATGALTYTPATGTLLSAGPGQNLTVDAAATSNYNAASKSVTIDVSKAPQTITWANPAAITYPTALSATQLNASVAGVTGGSATGAVTYTPALGTTLGAGNRPLKVDVAGTSDYLPATKTVYIVVDKGTPVLTWANPASIPQGTPLSGTQLNATANVPGSLSYAPAAGTVLLFGSNPLSTTFTPTDVDNYNSATANVSINVTNVAPSLLTLALPLPTEVTKPLTISGSFTDPGGQSDQHTITFGWYNGLTLTSISSGTPTVTYSGATGNFSLTRSDIPTGVYWVRVTVKDREGDAVSTDGRYVVVYDPNGGFVTGGGWIIADNGSCIVSNAPSGVCTSATGGRANFGFISKYQKGANAPTGNTEFQFQSGNLNFKSSVYQWLVISGAKAQYKGQGTINGGSTQYNFLLTGVDGGAAGGLGTDKFRIKITDPNNPDHVVFDNQMGGDETTGTGSALGGGSINIQSK
jgi:hypothetical protein